MVICPKCAGECEVHLIDTSKGYIKKFKCTECSFTKEIEVPTRRKGDKSEHS